MHYSEVNEIPGLLLLIDFEKAFDSFFNYCQDFIGSNVLTKFHKDWIINVNSIFSNILTKFHEHWTKNATSSVLTRKTARPLAAMTHVLTNFHADWPINKVHVNDGLRCTDKRRSQ
ncbi:hypothetical protein DPMN_135700 [Dreissena polymorpha]|uniref:Uncharacterized protein n=1 Tax=Dreissena polymorpha TaxID=45954 RepID=A0A9D4G4F5_DREPO|nr:hypothetical protein DPMN_135700 [Dreissena polymorpha]